MEENKTNIEVVEVEVVSEPTDQPFANEDVSRNKQEHIVSLPTLEEHKKAFIKAYNRSRIVSYLSTAIVIAIIVIAYWVVFPLEPNGTWAGIILIIITLVGSMVFSRVHRRKLTATVKEYMANYNAEVNNVALEKSEIRNYLFDFNGEISAEAFVEARFLKNIINTNSRNLLKYDVGSFNVEIADYVAYRKEGNQAKAAFLGKLISAKRSEKIDGRVLLYLKPDPSIFKDAAGPDDLEGLELLEDKPRYRLYATHKDLKKKISAAALEQLLAIYPDSELADLTLVMHDDKVLITLTYSDSLMVVPYKEEIPGAVIMAYQGHVTALNKFLALL